MIKHMGTFCSPEQHEKYRDIHKQFESQYPMPDSHCRDPYIKMTKEELEPFWKWSNSKQEKDPYFNVKWCGFCMMKIEEWYANKEKFITEHYQGHPNCGTCKLDFEIVSR